MGLISCLFSDTITDHAVVIYACSGLGITMHGFEDFKDDVIWAGLVLLGSWCRFISMASNCWIQSIDGLLLTTIRCPLIIIGVGWAILHSYLSLIILLIQKNLNTKISLKNEHTKGQNNTVKITKNQ